MRFFNLGGSELFLIFLLAIIAVGPKETLRLAGKARQFIKSMQDLWSDLSSEVTRAAAETMEEPKATKEE